MSADRIRELLDEIEVQYRDAAQPPAWMHLWAVAGCLGVRLQDRFFDDVSRDAIEAVEAIRKRADDAENMAAAANEALATSEKQRKDAEQRVSELEAKVERNTGFRNGYIARGGCLERIYNTLFPFGLGNDDYARWDNGDASHEVEAIKALQTKNGELQVRIAELEAKIERQRSNLNGLHKALDEAKVRAGRVPGLEADVARLRNQLETARRQAGVYGRSVAENARDAMARIEAAYANVVKPGPEPADDPSEVRVGDVREGLGTVVLVEDDEAVMRRQGYGMYVNTLRAVSNAPLIRRAEASDAQ